MALQQGLRCIAITDHDTVAGVEKIEFNKIPPGLTVLPGIEISTEYQGKELHILGYALDIYNPGLRQTLQVLSEARRQRIGRMVQRLEEAGLRITLREVQEFARDAASLGRPHIALALIQNGYAADIKEAFHKYLLKGRPGFVPRYRLATEEAIALIVQAGGIPVLAHPGNDLHPAALPHLLKAGLGGMEVFYPEHDEETRRYYYHLALQNKLLITGGSDFHGQEEEDFLNFGKLPVPAGTIEILKEALKS
jgi:predicted metal-dependent phosphoesterase TrpH